MLWQELFTTLSESSSANERIFLNLCSYVKEVLPSSSHSLFIIAAENFPN